MTDAIIIRTVNRTVEPGEPPVVVADLETVGSGYGSAILAEARRRRLLVAAGDFCPCGARAVLPNRAARRQAAKSGEAASMKAYHQANCVALIPVRPASGASS